MQPDSGFHRRRRREFALLLMLGLAACGSSPATPRESAPSPPSLPAWGGSDAASPAPSLPGAALIPMPAVVQWQAASTFTVTGSTRISVWPPSAEVRRAAGIFAGGLRLSTGFDIPVVGVRGAGDAPPGAIALELGPAGSGVGPEGYQLDVATRQVHLVAEAPGGLFHGLETIRQLLPAVAASPSRQPGPWPIAGVHIVDHPRFPWRGTMLDVARHFFGVPVVKRYIDEIALYKINVLHLHLSDDQGWRIAIDSWPRLAGVGGSTSVGGGPGGFYTQQQYAEIVAYAQARYITVVPEIDLPGHVNAALASYPELSCDGVAPPLYTGENVGFSSLCAGRDSTDRFLSDVIGELARITPGPYIHVGGDEARHTSPAEYQRLAARAQQLVLEQGKRAVGWAEVAATALDPRTVAECWNTDGGASARAAAARGLQIVASPAEKAYLDQKYDAQTRLGLSWAGYISVQDAYTWDPVDRTVPAARLLGVEAPLWSETLTTAADIEYMAFPRLPGIAEIGWSPPEKRQWDEYRSRLAQHGPRWTAMGVTFYRSPEVDWAEAVPPR